MKKVWIFPSIIWLAMLAPGGAQTNGLPPVGEGMGPSPLSPHIVDASTDGMPQTMLAPPPSAAGNSTGNFSSYVNSNGAPVAPGALTYGPGMMLPPPTPPGGNISLPIQAQAVEAAGGNATGPRNPPAVASPTAGGGYSSGTEVTMPSSMDVLDNVHKLTASDKIYYEVVQDRDPPRVLMVDEKGMVNVPYLGLRDVGGKTLREMAYMLQKELETNLYFNATVLAMPYSGTRTRQVVYVMGDVAHSGPIPMPADDVLTVWNAIWAAGGLAQGADATRVTVLRRDAKDQENMEKMVVNVEQIYTKGTGDVVLQAGDYVQVPSKGEANGFVTITGAVRAPGLMPLPVGSNVTVSQAILQAGGFTDWGDESVKLVHWDDKGKKTEQYVDVDAILNQGQREKDVKLQAGDFVHVYEKWIKFGF